MKKLFYFLLTVAASLSLASCVKEPVSVPDPALGGEPVAVSFSLNLGDALTKAAPEASPFDDASGKFKLYAAVFSKTDGSLISTSKIGGTGFQPVEEITAEKVSIVMTLSRSQEYKVVFFAMHDGAYDVNFAGGNVATFSYKSGLKANDASLDAFYASVDVASSTTKYDVTMKRPFAQLNVLVPTANVPAGQTAFSSSMTVNAPASFNLYSGAAGTDLKDITFATNAIAAAPVGAYKSTHKWIGMNFVLVPASGKVNVNAFTESGMKEPVQIGAVPVKVNSRTNIVGSIYSLSDYTFNLQIDPVFDDGTDVTIEEGGEGGGEGGQTPDEPEDTEIVIADGSSYTENAPFAIDASGTAAPKSVALLVNGDSFATVEAGANGAKITAASSNEAVATAEVKDGAVLITPKGNGKAKITVSTPAYTKAGYEAGSFEFWVEITGMAVPKKDVTITVTAPADGKLAIETGKTGTITATAKDADGNSVAIVYKSDNEAVATVKDGTVTAVRAGTTTITLTTAATETLNAAAEKKVEVTVTDPAQQSTDPTIADIKTAIGDATASKTFTAITLGKVIVTGKNSSQVWMEDATGGILLYLKDNTLEVGKSYTGAKVSKGYIYKGYYEIEDFDITNATVADAEIPTTTLTAAQVLSEVKKYESMHVKLTGVTFQAEAAGNKSSVTVKQGSDEVGVYIIPALTTAVKKESVADVTGIVSVYNNSGQITVVNADDIKVTSAGLITTTISGMANQSLKPGESYGFAATTNNPNGTIVYSIESGADVVTLAGNKVTVNANAAAGKTAVIKASVAATAGYSAAETTATITVKDANSQTTEKTVTFNKDNTGGLSTTAGEMTGTIDVISVHLENGTVNAANGDIRIYKGKKLTISTSTGTITKIVITSKSSDVTDNGPSKFGAGAPSGFKVDGAVGTWTGSSNQVDFIATDAQVRMESIVVTYE